MKPTPKQFEILRAVAAFAPVERYQGTLPKRQALFFAKDDLGALEDGGLLEKVKLSYPCGKSMAGWRLTPAGRAFLPEIEPEECGELAAEHLCILSDVYHYSRISSFHGMMPKDLAKGAFDGDDLRDLFTHGYLLRIRVKGQAKAKGWVVSNKGLAALRAAAAPPKVCAVAASGADSD
ncbi:conserved hypothetical protein [Solidesulfovibrio fructosivorans JJ]]|uniref:Uncharacterized protein n=1 Tax=Solidesulfovibrio fructosivorans JJ] TaxID=596151 RepID=E1K1C2_SOLFR|nr:hypothetical protein [Solidesulfovibrio fructosivorans]EFL49608.1 conserved hypothetical protein [Solidesulfovibrio fructosivorans JJ]]